MIHTIDNLALAEAINARAPGLIVPIQVNTGEDALKAVCRAGRARAREGHRTPR